jgi:hypothetical protein
MAISGDSFRAGEEMMATERTWATVESELALALESFEANQILILQARASNRYVQVFVDRGPRLQVELSSNEVLPPSERFSAWEWAGLLRLGWSEPITGKSPNFFASLQGKGAAARAARLAVRSLSEVMCMTPAGALDYKAFTSVGATILLPQLDRALQ